MLKLPNVTIATADCITPELSVRTMEMCSKHISFGAKLLLTDSEEEFDIPTRKISKITGSQDYSMTMLLELPKHIVTDFVLIIHNDGFVLNPDAWTDDFLKYDYIGAPWQLHPFHYYPPFPNVTEDRRVGNGGFCIRSKRLIQAVPKVLKTLVDSKELKSCHPEDAFIVRTGIFQRLGYTFAPYELAKEFSVENDIYTGQFGFHGKETMKMNNIKEC